MAKTNPRLAKELAVTLGTEKEVLRILTRAYSEMSVDIRMWERRQGIGVAVRRGQARLLQHAINRKMAEVWRQIGDTVKAKQAEAAGEASEPDKDILEYFRAAGLSDKDVKTMLRSSRLAAESTVEAAMKRIQGDSYRPLSKRVYTSEAWVASKLNDTINLSLLSGANHKELAKAVRLFIRPDVKGGVRYAATRLARTEINNAFHASSVKSMQAEPFTTYIHWHLSGSHPTPDDCNLYAEKTHYPGGDPGVYKKGDVPARPHPNCLCYTTGVDMGQDEFIKAFARGDFDDWLKEQGVDPGVAVPLRPLSAGDAVRKYAWGPGSNGLIYSDVNQGLREGKTLTGEALRVQQGLDFAFSNAASTGRTMNLYRQIPGDDKKLTNELLAVARKGEGWKDQAYVSTTRSTDILEDFSGSGGGVQLNIRLPTGNKVIHVDSYTADDLHAYAQDEWLLPRGTRFHLTNPRPNPGPQGGWLIDAEVVPEGKKLVAPAPKAAASGLSREELQRRIKSEQIRARKARNLPSKNAAIANVRKYQQQLRELDRKRR